MKGLIIGGSSGYTWDELKYWVNSIRETGFSGDVVIVTDNMTKETMDELTNRGVLVKAYGEQTESGGVEGKMSLPPHVSRFFYIWSYLDENVYSVWDYVVVTDVRDVIFQDDPILHLKSYNSHDIHTAPEGLTYENEPWGKQNLYQSFGPYFYNRIKDYEILNVGVIGGNYYKIRELMLLIFQLSFNRPIPIVDQAVYNFILRELKNSSEYHVLHDQEAWAINLGTTIEAIKAGHGDIGQACRHDYKLLEKYQDDYMYDQPKIKDGVVMTSDNNPYCIVHQYDRVPGLREQIQIKYGDNYDN